MCDKEAERASSSALRGAVKRGRRLLQKKERSHCKNHKKERKSRAQKAHLPEVFAREAYRVWKQRAEVRRRDLSASVMWSWFYGSPSLKDEPLFLDKLPKGLCSRIAAESARYSMPPAAQSVESRDRLR